MTSAQALEKFNILWDRTDSAYLEDDEIYSLLNMAQQEVLNRMVPDSLGGVVNFELDQNTIHNLSPLIYSYDTSMGANGITTFGTINGNLQSLSGDATCSLFRILSIGWGSLGSSGDTRIPVKFVPSNKYFAVTSNSFTTPTTSCPIFTIESLNGVATGLKFFPVLTSVNLKISCIKTPKLISASGNPDWGDYIMNQVILKAISLASVSSRDSETVQTTRNSGFQSAE